MVATLLRLRWRVLANTLSTSVWQLIGFIVGSLWAAGVLFMVGVALFFLGGAGAETTRAAIIGGGALLTLGWVLAPIFAAGLDTTLDPSRLAPFPIGTERMMLALTAAGLTGVPGIATTLAALATFAAWWRWPLAALAAVVAVPVGVLVCVVASRTLGTLSTSVTGGRRTREIIGAVVFALLVLAGPIAIGAQALVSAVADAAGTSAGATILRVVEVASWTPVAAAWAVPGDVAIGAWIPAVAKLAIAGATLAVLWLLWRRSLAASLVAPPARAARTVAAGRLGWFGRMPTGPVGAGWARSLTYWLHDPRYLRQLLFVPLLPVLVWVWTQGDAAHPALLFSAPLIAFFLGIVPYADVSYDGTAFGTLLATGVRGRAERAGRMLGAATVGLPVVVAAALLTSGISGRWDLLPAILGAAYGMLMTAYGICAVTSAWLTVPVPAPGDSPFKRVPGATFQVFLAFLVIWIVAAALAAPEVVLAILEAVLGGGSFGWAALASGLVLGTALFVAGILVGGRILDRTAPDLLLRLRAVRSG